MNSQKNIFEKIELNKIKILKEKPDTVLIKLGTNASFWISKRFINTKDKTVSINPKYKYLVNYSYYSITDQTWTYSKLQNILGVTIISLLQDPNKFLKYDEIVVKQN